MKAVVQRVLRARVVVNGEVVSEIGAGLLVLLGIGQEDGDEQVGWMADKIPDLRIFSDEEGKMNVSLLEVGAEALVVSQFTLYGDCRKGRRPSYSGAAAGETARVLYEQFCRQLRLKGVHVAEGVFGAHMQVELVNDGPVTLIVESPPSRVTVSPLASHQT
uniref:D-aminoacyl-tRNA deacylase n=1 Tax=Desulfomonile tiedjei TaxID=2358 RepID=A0A7C4ARV1_9BACT